MLANGHYVKMSFLFLFFFNAKSSICQWNCSDILCIDILLPRQQHMSGKNHKPMGSGMWRWNNCDIPIFKRHMPVSKTQQQTTSQSGLPPRIRMWHQNWQNQNYTGEKWYLPEWQAIKKCAQLQHIIIIWRSSLVYDNKNLYTPVRNGDSGAWVT